MYHYVDFGSDILTNAFIVLSILLKDMNNGRRSTYANILSRIGKGERQDINVTLDFISDELGVVLERRPGKGISINMEEWLKDSPKDIEELNALCEGLLTCRDIESSKILMKIIFRKLDVNPFVV